MTAYAFVYKRGGAFVFNSALFGRKGQVAIVTALSVNKCFATRTIECYNNTGSVAKRYYRGQQNRTSARSASERDDSNSTKSSAKNLENGLGLLITKIFFYRTLRYFSKLFSFSIICHT